MNLSRRTNITARVADVMRAGLIIEVHHNGNHNPILAVNHSQIYSYHETITIMNNCRNDVGHLSHGFKTDSGSSYYVYMTSI